MIVFTSYTDTHKKNKRKEIYQQREKEIDIYTQERRSWISFDQIGMTKNEQKNKYYFYLIIYRDHYYIDK
jgi:hypothetical protein